MNDNLLGQLAAKILKSDPPDNMQTRIVAIDGCGGAGKSTLAAALAIHFNNCDIIHSDDFASWDNTLNWFPRMIEQVLEPLKGNKSAVYQRYDWNEKKLMNWITVSPQPIIIIEGVSSSRKEFRPFLSFSIFVSTDRETRLQRGLERDGPQAKDQWLKWMSSEDEYIARDNPEGFADAIVVGK